MKVFFHIRPNNLHKLWFVPYYAILNYEKHYKGYKYLASNEHLYIAKHMIFDKVIIPYITSNKPSPTSDNTVVTVTSCHGCNCFRLPMGCKLLHQINIFHLISSPIKDLISLDNSKGIDLKT